MELHNCSNKNAADKGLYIIVKPHLWYFYACNKPQGHILYQINYEV